GGERDAQLVDARGHVESARGEALPGLPTAGVADVVGGDLCAVDLDGVARGRRAGATGRDPVAARSGHVDVPLDVGAAGDPARVRAAAGVGGGLELHVHRLVVALSLEVAGNAATCGRWRRWISAGRVGAVVGAAHLVPAHVVDLEGRL